MTDFGLSEEPPRLPAAGPAERSDSAGVVGVIETRPPAPARRFEMGDRSVSEPPVRPAAAPGAGGSVKRYASAVLGYLDVVLVVVALPAALSWGAPALGYVIGAGTWIVQRILAQADRRWIRSATTPRTQLGLNLFEAFGRIWLLAGAIVVAGVAGGRADGLTAALVIFFAYSVAFAIRVLSGSPSSAPGREVAR